jgi:hypothetical protein
MKPLLSIKYYQSRFFFLVFGFFIVFGVQAQEEKSEDTEKEKVESKAISIDNISDESEKIGKRIIDLREILIPNANITEVDSILQNIYAEVNLKKDSLLAMLGNLNKRELVARKVEWNNYYSILKDYQSVLKGRTEDVSKINDELVEEVLKWEQTKELLSQGTESGEIYDSLDTIIATLQEVIQLAHERLENLFLIQKDLTELVLALDGMLVEITLVEQQIQRDYFVFDSNPIWRITAIDSVATDSIQNDTALASQIVASNFDENIRQLQEFLLLNRKPFIFQIVFILLILSSLLIVRKRSKIDSVDLDNQIEREAEIVLSHPIQASIVVGVLISSFFYDEIIPILGEIFVFVVFSGTILLMPKLSNKKLYPFLLLLFTAYLNIT